jgi:hypothetical protein
VGDKIDQHQMVSALQALASELGRTPLRDEFIKTVRNGKVLINKYFANYATMVSAAGLTPVKRNVKIDNSVFNTSIEHHLEQYQAKELPKQEPWEKTLFIGDVHHPFAHQKTLEAAYRFAALHKPKRIIQGGDLYDMYSHTKFPRSHNVFMPKEEHEMSRHHAEKMWAELKNASPDAICTQLWGNHDARPLKRILEVYPSAEDWVTQMLTQMMSFPGVHTMASYREELFLPGNIQVIHGHRSKPGDHMNFSLMNSVNFHTHLGSVVYRNLHRHGIRWELNGGFVADPEAKGLTYTPQRITNWTRGFGYLDEYGPRFIPSPY